MNNRTKKSNGTGASVVAYLRVSSASQTAAMQRDAIERVASSRGEEIARWYEDRFTGGGKHPPGLVELLADSRQGKAKRVYVYRLDRLSRRGIRDLLGIVQDLESYGAELVSVADGFDLRGTARDVILAVLAWAAQMERQAIGERIQDARRRVEAKGGAWGRPRRMSREQVARAHELSSEGKTLREIASRLKIPRATVFRALRRKPVARRTLEKAHPRTQ